MDRLIKGVLGFVLVCLASPTTANETLWQDHDGMISTRIIVGSDGLIADHRAQLGNIGSDQVILAWEAKLADGWKTYWRSPGEAGLPVRVHQGETELELYYPVPQRFELFGLETYGYGKHVVIAFVVSQTNIRDGLQLNADFMVCKDICVPFRATYDVEVDLENHGNIVSDTRIKSWLERVPVREGAAPAGLEVTSVGLSGLAGHQKLVVEARSDLPMSKADLLVETGNMIQFLAPDRRLLSDGRTARFVLAAISSEKNADIAGQRLRLTLIDGRGNAIEQYIQVPSR